VADGAYLVNHRVGTTFFAVVAFVAAGASVAFAQVTPAPTETLTAHEAIAEAKRVFDDKLLDYRGTRFRDVRFVRVRTSFEAFCGQINTTNRMGGYTGWKAFLLPVGRGAKTTVYDSPTIEGEATSMGSFMRRYGTTPIEGDPAQRMIAGACGEDAVRLDEADHSAALAYRP
jgi:hypothetical protein